MDIELSGKHYVIRGTHFKRSFDIVWIDGRQMTLEEFNVLSKDDRGYLLDAIDAFIEKNAPSPKEAE